MAAVGGLGEDTATVDAIAGSQPVGAGGGARRVTCSGSDVVHGSAEMGTGARGEQSEALDEAGEGLGAAEGDKVSGKKRKRCWQAGNNGRLGRATRGEDVWTVPSGCGTGLIVVLAIGSEAPQACPL